MPVDKPASEPDVYAQAANGATASSSFAGGRSNIGGWSTDPSADALAANTAPPPAATQGAVRT